MASFSKDNVANDFAASPRGAENMFPSNPRRMYDSYRYNCQQQNSSRGMASAVEVPLRDATPSAVPSLHFPHNNDRRMYDSYRYNWQQQNSSPGMASAVEV